MAKEKADKKGAKKGDKKPAERKAPTVIVPRLQQKYFEEILPALKEKLGRQNVLSLLG